MTSGATLRPSLDMRSVANSVAVMGSLSMTVAMAPMPMATAGTSESPGRWAAATPMAAPMNMDGNTGPPRKPESESPYATDLQATRSTSAPTVQAEGWRTSPGRADCPDSSSTPRPG